MAVNWRVAEAELIDARGALAGAPPGVPCQGSYDRLLRAERRCTHLIHTWFAEALEINRVVDPRLVLSVDVDGVLEGESQEFSSTGLSGAAALRLLQLGRVAVLLSTAASLADVRDRVEQFGLLGGVGACGTAAWDAVLRREHSLLSSRGAAQLDRLRAVLRADPEIVLDTADRYSVGACRIVDSIPVPIGGPAARRLLDEYALSELTYWVTPRHTHFLDQRGDKGAGVSELRRELGLAELPMAAIGAATCDVPVLHSAARTFLPAATLPSYAPARRQYLVRSRYLGEQALWDAACQLVPNLALQRRVLATAQRLEFPEWFPTNLRRGVPVGTGLLTRLAAALASLGGPN